MSLDGVLLATLVVGIVLILGLALADALIQIWRRNRGKPRL